MTSYLIGHYVLIVAFLCNCFNCLIFYRIKVKKNRDRKTTYIIETENPIADILGFFFSRIIGSIAFFLTLLSLIAMLTTGDYQLLTFTVILIGLSWLWVAIK